MALEKILAFQVKDRDLEKLKLIAGNMRIKLSVIERKDFRQTVGDLLAQKRNPLLADYEGEAALASLIVMDDFSEKRLDALLKALKREQVFLDYKAVTTKTNKKWTVLQLYMEMEREKNAYLQKEAHSR